MDVRPYCEILALAFSLFEPLRTYQCLFFTWKALLAPKVNFHLAPEWLALVRDFLGMYLGSPAFPSAGSASSHANLFSREEVRRAISRMRTSSDADSARTLGRLESLLGREDSASLSPAMVVNMLSEGGLLALGALSQAESTVGTKELLDWMLAPLLESWGYSLGEGTATRLMSAAHKLFVDPLPLGRAADEALKCKAQEDAKRERAKRVKTDL